ncbi:hypothetical protein GWI33_009677 [Rhynchophorus ferrugineus]|uniref:Uncharacterized protein n=1 Tax=Rhynchophorus ferrugineus TaxID=354439 RepID=A0A834IF17_RHYFE|nr:hypothetical protein GWI33_009677 [Rhynchophorus ferrugineus]
MCINDRNRIFRNTCKGQMKETVSPGLIEPGLEGLDKVSSSGIYAIRKASLLGVRKSVASPSPAVGSLATRDNRSGPYLRKSRRTDRKWPARIPAAGELWSVDRSRPSAAAAALPPPRSVPFRGADFRFRIIKQRDLGIGRLQS